jgi:AcrR family transcriptional regulator
MTEGRFIMRVTKDADTRREEILKSSLELFREEGFEKITVESIAKKAGIAKGSFYNYFKSKEDAYEAVVSCVASQTLTLIKEILDSSGSPKERLLRYIDWTFELAEKQEKSLSRVLSPDTNKVQQKIYLAALDEATSQMIPIFTKLFEEGIAKGDFDLPDASYTAAFLLGAFRGVHSQFYKNQETDMETSRNHLMELLSRLLGMNEV